MFIYYYKQGALIILFPGIEYSEQYACYLSPIMKLNNDDVVSVIWLQSDIV